RPRCSRRSRRSPSRRRSGRSRTGSSRWRRNAGARSAAEHRGTASRSIAWRSRRIPTRRASPARARPGRSSRPRKSFSATDVAAVLTTAHPTHRKGLPVDFTTFPPFALALEAASALLTALSSALAPLVGASSAALAVVLLTLAVRAALVPLGAMQVRAEVQRRRLAPRLAELQRRHKKNPERLQRETLEL